MLKINKLQKVENEHLYGPGKRLLIVCQGCSLHCKGCINKHLWAFNGGHYIKQINLDGLDGVTLFGGEPLDQASDLYLLLKEIDKTIILFTGYRKKELNKIQKKIWDLSDIVVSGRFVEKKKNINLQFRGSSNQRIYFHKGKYKNYMLKDGFSSCNFAINIDGTIDVNGFITSDIENLLNCK